MPNGSINTVPENHHSPAATIATVPPLSGKTILLVEDESFIAELLVSWLGRLGAITLCANNGSEGIRLLTEHAGRVSAVIADFRLPDMSGDDMCAQLRQLQPGIPVLLSSGRYQDKAMDSIARTGPTCFIQKPYPLDDVIVKLKKLLAMG